MDAIAKFGIGFVSVRGTLCAALCAAACLARADVLDETYDVVVVGGSSYGVAAATAASRTPEMPGGSPKPMKYGNTASPFTAAGRKPGCDAMNV